MMAEVFLVVILTLAANVLFDWLTGYPGHVRRWRRNDGQVET
jgi:hypothetical protein